MTHYTRKQKGGGRQLASAGFLPNDPRYRRNAAVGTGVYSKAPFFSALDFTGMTQAEVNEAIEAFSVKVIDALQRGQLVEKAP